MKPSKARVLQTAGLSLALSLSVLGGSALAAASALPITQAVDLALQQNIDLKLSRLAFENAEMAYKKTMASNPSTVAKSSAEIAWEKAQSAFKTAKTDIVTTTLSTYLSLQSAAFDSIVKEKQTAAALRSLERTKVFVQKGTLGTLDELQAELAYMQAVNTMDKTRESYAESTEAFANFLGQDKLPVLSEADFLIMPEFNMPLADALKAAMQNSITLKEKTVSLDLARIQRAQDQLLELAPIDERKSANDLTSAELALAKTQYDLEESITTAYNGLMQAKKGIVVAQNSNDIEVKKFDIVRKQFDAGLKTASDLDNAEIALLQAQSSLRSAKRGYVLAWLGFQKTLGNEIDLNGVVKPDAAQ